MRKIPKKSHKVLEKRKNRKRGGKGVYGRENLKIRKISKKRKENEWEV